MKKKVITIILLIFGIVVFWLCFVQFTPSPSTKIILFGEKGTLEFTIEPYGKIIVKKGYDYNFKNKEFDGKSDDSRSFNIYGKKIWEIKNLIKTVAKTKPNDGGNDFYLHNQEVLALINNKTYWSLYRSENYNINNNSDINKELLNLTNKLLDLSPIK